MAESSSGTLRPTGLAMLCTRARRGALPIALASALAGSFALLGCGAGTLPRTPSVVALAGRARRATTAAAATRASAFRFFSPSSFWNEAVRTDAPLDPTSGPIVAALAAAVGAEEQLHRGPWINTTSYSVPVYTVPRHQPTVRVHLANANNPALARAWRSVPLPRGARPAAGTDGILVVWQPSSERLWEFWRLVDRGGRWQASWGGAMDRVATRAGVFERGVWPGAQPTWGASASSLSVVGGLITIEDLALGQIDHALAMAVPEVRAGVYAAPAQRTDGDSPNPLALPEGAHLRLNPSLDLAALHLPPLTMMLAQAAQRYGIFVTDRSPIVELYAQDPTPTGADPYTAPGGFYGGAQPSQLLASFPWSELQLLSMTLRRRRGTGSAGG